MTTPEERKLRALKRKQDAELAALQERLREAENGRETRKIPKEEALDVEPGEDPEPEDLSGDYNPSDVPIESIRDGKLEPPENVVEVVFDHSLRVAEILATWHKPELLDPLVVPEGANIRIEFASLKDGRAVRLKCASGLELVYDFAGRLIR